MQPAASLTGIIQAPNELVLGLTSIPLPAGKVHVLCSEQVQIEDFIFGFHIVGESHLVRIERSGQLVVQELLACTDLDAAQCLLYHSFADLVDYQVEQGPYRVSVEFADRLRWNLPDQAALDGEITVRFPATHDAIPFTQISWQARESRVQWWTLHSYPCDGGVTYVYSHSQYACV